MACGSISSLERVAIEIGVESQSRVDDILQAFNAALIG